MSKRPGILLTAIATSGLVLLSTAAGFAQVRDHRGTPGQTYGGIRGGGGCRTCAGLSTAPGGVLVTQGNVVLPTKLAPPPLPLQHVGGGGRR